MKQHMILGKNRRDVEARRDEWISENPGITVVRVHRPKREPESWLTRLGGRDVPRVSIIVEYEADAQLSPQVSQPESQQATAEDATADADETSTLSPT